MSSEQAASADDRPLVFSLIWDIAICYDDHPTFQGRRSLASMAS
jgi:hypothetical protein